MSFGKPLYAFVPSTHLSVESIGYKMGECSTFRDETK